MLKRLPTNTRNNELRFAPNRAVLSRLLLYMACGVLLSGGFLFAVWQHSAAVKYGYQFEQLRQERRHLEIERQQLQAARERVVALPNLEGAALAAGLRAMQGSQFEVAQKGRRQ